MARWLVFYLVFVLLRTPPAFAASDSVVPTSNFIDTLSGYADLSSCAEGALSTIVRDQSSGCGDNQKLTSYTCFCTDSSRFFSFIISSAVSESCKSSSQAAQIFSALQVWDSYCALGVEAGLATTTKPSSTPTVISSASPAAGATTAGATQTAVASTLVISTASAAGPAASSSVTSIAVSGSRSSENSKTTAIAAGVAVPVGVIGLALVGYLFYRKHQQGTQQRLLVGSPPAAAIIPVHKQPPMQEMPYNNQIHELQSRSFNELESGNMRHEADPDALKEHGRERFELGLQN